MSHSLFLIITALLLGVTAAVDSAAAQTDTHCAPGASPQFTAGFSDLSVALGAAMGTAVSCEYPDPSGTGDVEQNTDAGLAFWRKSTNTPTFTNGSQHWAHAQGGWLTWTGVAVDPPANAQPFTPTQTGTAGSSGTAGPPNTPPSNAPTQNQIESVMTATVEVDEPSEHFQVSDSPLTVPDGMGGTVTAVAGQRVPTADGHGQLVFFWHNTTFVSWDADYETVNIVNITSPGSGTFVVTYAEYADSDALCCPSLAPSGRTYQWDGQAFRGNLPPPTEPPLGSRVSVKLSV